MDGLFVQRISPQSGTVAVVSNSQNDILMVVDTDSLAELTVPFSRGERGGIRDKQIFGITTRSRINSIVLDADARSINGPITSLDAGHSAFWIYVEASNAWFPYIVPPSSAGAVAWGAINGTLSSQLDLQAALNTKINNDVDLLAIQALGSPFLAETVGQQLSYANTASNLVDGQIRYISVYLPKASTLTGVKFYSRVAGSYTPDNNNRIGLYSYNAGVLTLAASIANTGALWTSAANAVQTIPFAVPILNAAAGIYYVALLYNQSAQVTVPALAAGVSLNNAAMSGTAYGFANSAKLFGTSTGADLLASINMTAITASAIPTWAALY